MLSIQLNLFVMNSRASKLVLGSANFGLDYGLTNEAGRISKFELKKILYEAKLAKIKLIDTAQAYGDSEARIGSLCSDGCFDIVTKINIGLEKDFFANSVSNLVKQSCERLNKSQLYAVMLHNPEVLLAGFGGQIIEELQNLKAQNIVSKVGVSIYSPTILEEILTLLKLDIVQVPFNIFDQKILSSGWAEKLKDHGTEVHARSVFLQGLLLMQRSSLHSYFENNWPSLFDLWYEFMKTNGYDAATVALNFVLKQELIDKVVVGVNSAAQLRALVEIENSRSSLSFPQFDCNDENLLNPSKWKLM